MTDICDKCGLPRFKDMQQMQAGIERLRKESSARLVSYAPDGSTCTLNIDGVEMYYDRIDEELK